MAEWSIPLETLAAKTGQKLETIVRIITIDLFSRVVIRSPVDTGRFRANWNVSWNVLDETVSNRVDSNGSFKLRTIQSTVAAMKLGGVAYLCNALPYAIVLEYGGYPNPAKFGSKKRGEDYAQIHTVSGYSLQAPNGMVRLTAREFDEAVRKAIGAVQ